VKYDIDDSAGDLIVCPSRWRSDCRDSETV